MLLSTKIRASKEWDHEKAFHGAVDFNFSVSLHNGNIFTGAYHCEDCTVTERCGSNDCFLCRRFGYHLDTMLDFCSGTLLATKPVTLRISVAENAGFISVTVNGAAQNGNAYLGVSFYPSGCRDSLKEGRFDCRQVQSSFSEIWTIPEKFKGGRYDIALWNNRINKNECTLKSCVWCKKLGYHLWWLLFLKSGVIEAHQQ
ncbi:MAG: hypothetical protein AB2L14_22990 [Candidatus Xenobiia bacterium LiM19]